MSDIKLFNLKNQEVLKKRKVDKFQLQLIIEENISNLLGITLIGSNIQFLETHERIETLGYDENYQLVVIEYRSGKFGSTINKGLIFLDYIINNPSKVKSYLNEKLGYQLTSEIILNPRLISIGDDFNLYDDHAIKQMPFTIDLIKYQLFDKNLIILEKNYQSNKICINDEYHFTTKSQYDMYKMLSDFILSLGDEVVEVGFNGYFIYRKIRNFIYLFIGDGIEIKIKINNNFKTIKIKNYKDFEKYQILIEQSYDEN